jgi:hypothetical protein
VGLQRGPLNLVRIIEEIFQETSGSGLESRINGRGDSLRWPRDTLYPLNSALTSPTSGGRSIGIIRLRTKTIDFFVVFMWFLKFSFRPDDGLVTPKHAGILAARDKYEQ